MNTFVQSLLPHLFTVVPAVLFYAVALSLCLMRRRTLGRAGTYASQGFGLLLFSSLMNAGAQAWLMASRLDDHLSTSEMAARMGFMSIFSTLLWLAAMSLLLAAILARRPAQSD